MTKQRLAEVAHGRILREILDRKLLPGTPLLENVLAEKYEMSKTPVREALLALNRTGLVDSVSRRWYVRNLNIKDACEIYQLRLLLEPAALEDSARFFAADDIAKLRGLLADARRAIEARNLWEAITANAKFHKMLISRATNRRMVDFLVGLQEQMAVVALNTWAVQPTYEREAGEHEAVVDALEKGDIDEAAKRLKIHFLNGQRDRCAAYLGHPGGRPIDDVVDS